MRAPVVGLAVVMLLGSACGGSSAAPEPPAEVTGRVTYVEVEGGSVTGFGVATEDEDYDFLIDPARDYGFDLHHLEEHEDSEEPVIVRSEITEGKAFATSIEDAE